MNSSEIRQRFLDFFASQDHAIVPSSPLVPNNDPTLLFTNAGMVQFKDVFLGQDQRPYVRAASSQRCVRAGGKHNDLENVGYTARHHTFFEMLGNFSFGDYFKHDAIHYAWRFLTQSLQIPQQKLWVTVYAEDDEAANIWLNEIGIEPDRLVRIASSDNFWQMGDTGPCGPCSEIFYDHGPEVTGGPPGSADADGDRYIEIWNLVFMQYNRDSEGVLHALPKPSVDTGMGLERISAVMQAVHSNYDIDLFQYLIQAAARVTNTKDLTDNSLKVIADHIRACSFLITDGVIPSSEGRGYVLRRIIRRAIRHGYRLGQKQPFLYQLVEDLSQVMGQAYPELSTAKSRVAEVLRQEEERFAETIENGMQILEHALSQPIKILDGETAFKLYDTFGFPLDLTADIARERNINVDHAAFEQAMTRQREQARAVNKFTMQESIRYNGNQTTFRGYDTLQQQATILALYKQGTLVDQIEAGDEAIIVLDETPFYAESGGQVGDSGEIFSADGLFIVDDTQKIQANVFGHYGQLQQGRLITGSQISTKVNAAIRANTANNHSATHLLHAALRKILGTHVTQKGSLVNANRLRFDFSHNAPLTHDEIRDIERIVNDQIRINSVVSASSMAYDDAIKCGAMALFGEKYSDVVRVIGMDNFSIELCGGTHVTQSGQIGLFKITMESGVAAGIRRIEAVTGKTAIDYIQQRETQLLEIAQTLKINPQEVTQKVVQILENVRQTEKELARLKSQLANAQGDDLMSHIQEMDGVKVLAAKLDNADSRVLRETLDQLKEKLKSCVVVLGSTTDDKVTLIAGVTSDLTQHIKAGELVNFVAQQVGGKGGGRADMAQAGGSQPNQLPAALASVYDWAKEKRKF
ncbi:alanyl-tRNA synthetase [Nitrosomonas sp. PY1]|uniref:alanine--tRNA ligase n=1 Tax=Nitrosomonas sp. PY1 TaxID=1803906 RepID=UPI001FC7EA31|nr:alanine--tRNA ligase [Nitrosomonas sp. PY1]GKS70099.1 alanyl-tRNA synthetase [Nitrosomonas sp. PY1]